MMTKKDFELIASVIHLTSLEFTGDQVVKTLAYRFATVLANTNPRFDRARFLEACGVQS